MKIAFLFPGQGAQTVGMGKDIYDEYEEAREIYEKAEQITGIPVKKLCFEGPQEELTKTENTQICIFTTSLAMLAVLQKNEITANIAVGLSLGEYVALVYGGYLKIKDAIELIQKRGYYMGNFLPKQTYAMAAVIGISSDIIEEECKKARQQGNFVVPANYNCKMQTVISGTLDAINIVTENLKQAGARKVILLKTSGPFHTEKLQKAKELFLEELKKVSFKQGNDVKVIKNINGQFYNSTDNMQEILSNHIISPVRFDKAIELMKEQEITDFIEIGPGKTLTGFVKKDYPEANIYNINSLQTMKEVLQKIKN